MQQQHGALWWRKLFDQFHKLRFLFAANEQFAWITLVSGQSVSDFWFKRLLVPALTPPVHAFAMRDAEKPTAKAVVIAQAREIAGGADESFLYDIKRGLLAADEFKDVGIQWHLVTLEEGAPCFR